MAQSVKSSLTTNTALVPAIGGKMSLDRKISLGSIISIIVSLITLIGVFMSVGVAWGAMDERMKKLEIGYNQASLDSRTLIEVSKDVAYIKESILRIERAASLASAPLSLCPTEKPILVASHCRSYPSLD